MYVQWNKLLTRKMQMLAFLGRENADWLGFSFSNFSKPRVL